MKITSITRQVRDQNRVNISVDGKYLFSLDEFQLVELEISKNIDYSQAQIDSFVEAGVFGKLYARTVVYCLSRLHSSREIKNYLYRKTLSSIDKKGIKRPGVNQKVVVAVFNRLLEKGYIDDEKFALFWIENRFVKKGISQKRLRLELNSKGIDEPIVNEVLSRSKRNDDVEIQKIIVKRRSKYDDDKKLIQYLIRQGFHYGDIERAIESI